MARNGELNSSLMDRNSKDIEAAHLAALAAYQRRTTVFKGRTTALTAGINISALAIDTRTEVFDLTMNEIPIEPTLQEQEVHDHEVKDIKCKFVFILLFILISLNDGMVLGYKNSLSAYFTEKKVPSEQRTLLNLINLTYILRMLFAPLADRHFSAFIGKRRSYLLPCKIFAAAAYFGGSLYIDQWVNERDLVMITIYFFSVNFVMVLENNALQGLRLDFFGRKHAGSAGASYTIATVLGTVIGLQLFTVLNSARAMKKFFNHPEPVLTNQGFLLILSGLSLAAIPIQFIIPDIRERVATSAIVNNTWRVIKSLFKTKPVWNSVVWNFVGPTLSMGMKVVVAQYYISRGANREDLVVLLAVVLIPVTFIANLVWIHILDSGRLMFKLWIAVLLSVAAQSLHAVNYYFFDPNTNYRQTLIVIGVLTAIDTFCNWLMVQSTFYLSTASKKYSVSYISTVNSLLSASRIGPIAGMNALIDYVPMSYFFGGCVLLQLVYSIFTYNQINEIDKYNYIEIGLEFEQNLEDLNAKAN